ncbi:MAG: bifunctional adenosylcobinamide kinase/adenosylcobinamide-phosphate guanylyltransferase [Bacteroidaceae bacterium]|nr:bifunctional adenosylcobinamide kinase/adenosylcobinamide-phosphate guanylyltransferase [Bacteroidaceae bacterium]
MKRIILITGGERSGKSTFAEQMALGMSLNPIYIATAHPWDDEFRQRIRRHQERRVPQWTNIEEERELSKHQVEGRVVLIDCLTLWATNFFFANEGKDVEEVLGELKDEFLRFTNQEATFIFVTNEIGMGGVSPNAVQRRFTDLMGWLNQFVAQQADEVVLMVSGIPVKLKS